MAGPLVHSPASIIRALLVSKGMGADPPSLIWPIYDNADPATPDNIIFVMNEPGKSSGRVQVDGTVLEHHGISVHVRSTTPAIGYVKARQIAVVLDTEVYQDTVIIGSSTYFVHSATRTDDVLAEGKESPTSKRTLHAVNALVSLRQVN